MAEAQTRSTPPPQALRTRAHTNPTSPVSPPSKRTKPIQSHPTTASTMSKSAPYPPGLSLPLDDETSTTASVPTNATSSATLKASALHQAAAETIPLQVKKLRPEATPPTRGSKHSAGYDIYVCEDAVVPKWGKAMLSTGIACAIPPGTYGRIAPRSGLAAKHSIATGAGVIDYDYRGEVKVLVFNHSDKDFAVSAGDRMAQLVLERIVNPEVVVVEELDGTERGAGGFGSTGGFGFVSAAGTGTGASAGMNGATGSGLA